MSAGLLFAAAALLISRLLAPTSKNAAKGEAYECGVPTKGPAWMQFRIGYYLFALLFLLFDVEVVFLFPWAVVVKEVGMLAFVEVLFFLTVLFLGLLYAWRKGVLKWM
ncbi:MAG: NADH-quinone oxidoreductase subunit A [Bacteroidia bacterium]